MLQSGGVMYMDWKKASDFDRERLSLFDRYVHGLIDRRGFLNGAAKFTVGGMTAGIFLDVLNPTFAEAQQIAKNDKRLLAEYVEYSSPQGNGKMRGYLAFPWRQTNQAIRAPAGLTGRRRPGVLVVHENRGLTPHIEDIVRRLAIENFVAFAPDALTPLGGYPGDEDKARELFGKLDQAKMQEDFVAAASYLKNRRECTGTIGVIGFGDGGGIANMLATRLPDLTAAASFYGNQPKAEDVAKIKATVMIHYAENDPRINAGWPAFETALKANRVSHVMYRYPGTQHGFNNDTGPRYDEAAAKLAWQRTVNFFLRYLRK
jgi:carboxymethylenebutenolidase